MRTDGQPAGSALPAKGGGCRRSRAAAREGILRPLDVRAVQPQWNISTHGFSRQIPIIRALFPTSMTTQRERMFAALARLVWSLDNQPGCAEILGQLGRDHRRFGVTERHYSAFFAALRDTAEHFIGSDWTPRSRPRGRSRSTISRLDHEGGGGARRADLAALVDRRDRLARAALARRRGDPAAAQRSRYRYQAGQYVPVQVTGGRGSGGRTRSPTRRGAAA